MLLDGINHVAIVADGTDRLQHFYADTFGATGSHDIEPGPGMRLSIIHIGPHTELNVFEMSGVAAPSWTTATRDSARQTRTSRSPARESGTKSAVRSAPMADRWIEV